MRGSTEHDSEAHIFGFIQPIDRQILSQSENINVTKHGATEE
jgi:hypothetical protein